MVEIELNGAPHAAPENGSLADLVAALDLAGKGLATCRCI